MAVRYYIDADILGLGHVLSGTRWDVTYPGDPGGTFKRHRRGPCAITEAKTKDLVWMPVVGRVGWLVITRDQHIRQKPAEVESIYEHNLKLVAIVTPHPKDEKLDTFRQLEIVLSNWREVDKLPELPGPFVYTLSRTGGLTPVERPSEVEAKRPRRTAAKPAPLVEDDPMVPRLDLWP